MCLLRFSGAKLPKNPQQIVIFDLVIRLALHCVSNQKVSTLIPFASKMNTKLQERPVFENSWAAKNRIKMLFLYQIDTNNGELRQPQSP
ncbi:MAG TPA: hypothetical protein DCM62_07890 [Bacteroidales bacterium]|nr:hypothetical protein [Bacteroidales bacterium]